MVSSFEIAQRVDFTHQYGDTFYRNLTFTYEGAAIDFSGCTFSFSINDLNGNNILNVTPTVNQTNNN